MERGLFLVFEGIDGAGTTTQSRRLAQRLLAERPDLRVLVTAEPTDRPVGGMIRDVLGGRLAGVGPTGDDAPFDRVALALLFAADRLDHVAC
ncbi:MAG: dTMP kinase, partial [Deltaproteobacteria bacterium]|nr:dTMP kinase [Deltaproteobacteria bacterium]